MNKYNSKYDQEKARKLLKVAGIFNVDLTPQKRDEKIDNCMEKLSYREREIIKLRYGMGDGYHYTLEEVGMIFKVTKERVRQVEAKAIRKLQKLEETLE